MKRLKLIILAAVITMLAVLISAPAVSADMGPKPSVELHITNPPEGLYYVDLLQDHDENSDLNLIYNEEKCEEYGLNYDMVQTMFNYSKDGWYPRKGGIMDDCINVSCNDHIYNFTYNVPDEFKIIIVTEDLQTIISPLVKPRAYNCIITLDAEKCATTEKESSVSENHLDTVLHAIIAFFITCGATILIERFVFFCFRINMKIKENKRFFYLMNIITQLLLYLFIEISGQLFIPAEILIFTIEACLFSFKMKEVGKRRIIACTVTANLISTLVGGPLFIFLFWLTAL